MARLAQVRPEYWLKNIVWEIFLRKTLSERYSPQGGAGDLSRTGSVAGGLGGIVSGGFLKLGYIPVSQVMMMIN